LAHFQYYIGFKGGGERGGCGLDFGVDLRFWVEVKRLANWVWGFGKF